MGGRGGGGGTPRGPGDSGGSAPMSTEERDFRQWLRTAPPIEADRIDDPDSRSKVIITLPDRNVYISRPSKGRHVAHDDGSDEILFAGRSDGDLYRQISKFYGVQVRLSSPSGRHLGTFGIHGDPGNSPAARKYGA